MKKPRRGGAVSSVRQERLTRESTAVPPNRSRPKKKPRTRRGQLIW
jgi:hypothetical protein